MRTDIKPALTELAAKATPSAKDQSLTNQLFSLNDNRGSFDRLYQKQVQRGQNTASEPKDHVATRPERHTQAEKPVADRGKELPPKRGSTSATRQDNHTPNPAQDNVERVESRGSATDPQQSEARADSNSNFAKKVATSGSELSGEPVQNNAVSESNQANSADTETAQSSNPDIMSLLSEAELLLENMGSDIKVSKELLERARQALINDDFSLKTDDQELSSLLSEEELQALSELFIQQGGDGLSEGEGLTPAAMASFNAVTMVDSVDENSGSAKDAKSPLQWNMPGAALSSGSGSMQGQASLAQSKHTATENISADLTAEQGPDSVELAKEKKADLTMATKPVAKGVVDGLPEGDKITPVQERLAALARALDGNPHSRPERGTSRTDALKSLSSSASRTVESVSAGPVATGRILNSAVQSPVPTNMQNALVNREWAGELGQRLMMMVSSKIQSAQIQLNPRDMGPIDIKVSMQQDQANVVFSTQVSQTKEALELALPRLREMFEENGLGLADVDVQQQDANESHQGQAQQDGSSQAQSESDSVEAESQVVQQHTVGLVDYYA